MGHPKSSQTSLSLSRCTVNFDEQILLDVGHARYLGLPVKDFRISVLPDDDSVVTMIHVSEDRSMSHSWYGHASIFHGPKKPKMNASIRDHSEN